MLKKSFIFTLTLLVLVACAQQKVSVAVPVSDYSPGSDRSPGIELRAHQGLVNEPVFGGQVYIDIMGNPSGPVIIFIHGLGDRASKTWDQTVQKLEQDYFLVSLDLPGFGQSTKANQLYSPENYVRLIHYIHQTYVGKPFHLVGHSMGGAISLRYAASYPDEIETLTLIDAAGILHRLAYTQYLAPLGLKSFAKYFVFDQKDVSSLAGFVLNKLGSITQIDPKFLLEQATFRSKVLKENPSVISGMALVFDDLSQMPGRITAPTQIIWGDQDDVAPPRTGYVLNALIPDSKLHLIAQSGHIPISQNPTEFHRLLMEGITQSSSASSTPEPNQTEAQNVSCNQQNNVQYTGNFTKLEISHCKNVTIEDATIDQLLINDSRVFLRNVNIESPDIALIVKRSTVEITTGRISGDIAIEAHDSRLDIAGTSVSGRRALITAPLASSAIFSLVPKLSRGKQLEILHGQVNITPDQPLL